VENKLHITSTGQSTNQHLVQKSGLRRILFYKSCGACFYIKNLACGACFLQRILFVIILRCIWFQVSCSVYQFIGFKRFCWHDLSHSAWLWQWGANNLDKTESPPKVCMCGVSTQQWPSTQIALFERTRQSAWPDAVTTPLTRSEWILVY